MDNPLTLKHVSKNNIYIYIFYVWGLMCVLLFSRPLRSCGYPFWFFGTFRPHTLEPNQILWQSNLLLFTEGFCGIFSSDGGRGLGSSCLWPCRPWSLGGGGPNRRGVATTPEWRCQSRFDSHAQETGGMKRRRKRLGIEDRDKRKR